MRKLAKVEYQLIVRRSPETEPESERYVDFDQLRLHGIRIAYADLPSEMMGAVPHYRTPSGNKRVEPKSMFPEAVLTTTALRSKIVPTEKVVPSYIKPEVMGAFLSSMIALVASLLSFTTGLYGVGIALLGPFFAAILGVIFLIYMSRKAEPSE